MRALLVQIFGLFDCHGNSRGMVRFVLRSGIFGQMTIVHIFRFVVTATTHHFGVLVVDMRVAIFHGLAFSGSSRSPGSDEIIEPMHEVQLVYSLLSFGK